MMYKIQMVKGALMKRAFETTELNLITGKIETHS